MIVADGKQLSKAITTSLIKKTISIFVVSYLKTKSYEKKQPTQCSANGCALQTAPEAQRKRNIRNAESKYKR